MKRKLWLRSNGQSNNKVMQLDPPLCEKELQRLLDLYYKDCADQEGVW
jgi:hypothetical protein